MPYVAKTPKPPYYAVVFTSINANVDHTEPLGIEPARNSDGTGVAAVYFKDQEPIEAWAKDPEHQVAKRKGRETWYSYYMIRICGVEREYGRPDR